MADGILLVYMYGDFGASIVIGLATDKENAVKLMVQEANKFTGPWPKSTIREVSEGKFRKEPNTLSDEPYDYWIEKAKLNALIV